jgi:hypothetical protein
MPRQKQRPPNPNGPDPRDAQTKWLLFVIAILFGLVVSQLAKRLMSSAPFSALLTLLASVAELVTLGSISIVGDLATLAFFVISLFTLICAGGLLPYPWCPAALRLTSALSSSSARVAISRSRGESPRQASSAAVTSTGDERAVSSTTSSRQAHARIGETATWPHFTR